MEATIPVRLTKDDVKTIRRISACISGYNGGRAKSMKKARSSKRNGMQKKAA